MYKGTIEPIGFRAKEHNEAFYREKGRVVNRFTKLFLDRFCVQAGNIDWGQLVEYNSGNLDMVK